MAAVNTAAQVLAVLNRDVIPDVARQWAEPVKWKPKGMRHRPAGGRQTEIRIELTSAGIAVPAVEGGAFTDIGARDYVEGYATLTERTARTSTTTTRIRQIQKSPGAAVDETERLARDITNAFKVRMQIDFAGSGNGHLASVVSAGGGAIVVDDATVFRKNQKIDVWDTEALTGGATKTGDSLLITAVNRVTNTLTVTGTISSILAGHSVVSEDSRTASTSRVHTGLKGLIDDGRYSTTVHNLTRATYPELNAQCFDAPGGSGTKQQFTRELWQNWIHLTHLNFNGDEEVMPDSLIMTRRLHHYVNQQFAAEPGPTVQVVNGDTVKPTAKLHNFAFATGEGSVIEPTFNEYCDVDAMYLVKGSNLIELGDEQPTIVKSFEDKSLARDGDGNALREYEMLAEHFCGLVYHGVHGAASALRDLQGPSRRTRLSM